MMRYLGKLFTLMAACFCLCWCASAQELHEMQLSDVPEAEQKPVVVQDQSEAILVVYTTVPELSFESNIGIIAVNSPYSGVYHLHLYPGTNIVIIKAVGYSSLEYRCYIDKKQSKQVKIAPKSALDLAGGRGTLRLETSPPGARVTLNNIPHPNKTPLTLTDQPSGSHSIHLEMSGYVSLDTILTVTKNKTTTFQFTLTRAYAGIKVTSDPTAATVYLDGELLGQTPLERRDLPPGEGTLLVQLDGYVTSTQPVRLTTGELSTINLYLVKQTGIAEFITSPQGAEVFLDGASLGIYQGTPLVADKLTLGQHSARATLEGYGDTTVTFETVFNVTQTVNLRLKGKAGAIFVASTPTGASINLDGTDTGQRAPYKLTEVSAGQHELILRLAGYGDVRRSVTVVPNKTATISETMKEVATQNYQNVEKHEQKEQKAIKKDAAVKFGIKLGMNISKFYPYTDLNPEAGPCLGAFFHFRLYKFLGLQAEFMYSKKGGKIKGDLLNVEFIVPDFSVFLDYVEIPILLKLTISTGKASKFQPFLLMGPVLNFFSVARTGENAPVVNSKMRDFELSVVPIGIGCNFRIGKWALFFEYRYTLGVGRNEIDVVHSAYQPPFQYYLETIRIQNITQSLVIGVIL